MDTGRHELTFTSSLVGSKTTISGTVNDKVFAIAIDPLALRITNSIVAPRVVNQHKLAAVPDVMSGTIQLSDKSAVLVKDRKHTLGRLSRVRAASDTGVMTELLYKANGAEFIVTAEQILEIMSAQQIVLKLSEAEANALPIYRDDQAIARDVELALDQALLDPRQRRDIHARVEDGRVDLSGLLEAQDLLDETIASVQRVSGVRRVLSDIIVTESLADTVVRALDALVAKGSLGENAEINVLSEHQIIYLQGRVATAKASAEAERAALAVGGVRIVVNNLRVVQPENTERADPASPATHNR